MNKTILGIVNNLLLTNNRTNENDILFFDYLAKHFEGTPEVSSYYSSLSQALKDGDDKLFTELVRSFDEVNKNKAAELDAKTTRELKKTHPEFFEDMNKINDYRKMIQVVKLSAQSILDLVSINYDENYDKDLKDIFKMSKAYAEDFISKADFYNYAIQTYINDLNQEISTLFNRRKDLEVEKEKRELDNEIILGMFQKRVNAITSSITSLSTLMLYSAFFQQLTYDFVNSPKKSNMNDIKDMYNSCISLITGMNSAIDSIKENQRGSLEALGKISNVQDVIKKLINNRNEEEKAVVLSRRFYAKKLQEVIKQRCPSKSIEYESIMKKLRKWDEMLEKGLPLPVKGYANAINSSPEVFYQWARTDFMLYFIDSHKIGRKKGEKRSKTERKVIYSNDRAQDEAAMKKYNK